MAVAPDMRGYGRSTADYPDPASYRQELVVADLLHLLGVLGRRRAVWVGHDWGSPTVFNLATHHPEAVAGVASLCVPFNSLDRGLDRVVR